MQLRDIDKKILLFLKEGDKRIAKSLTINFAGAWRGLATKI
jgi:hypothetical protein